MIKMKLTQVASIAQGLQWCEFDFGPIQVLARRTNWQAGEDFDFNVVKFVMLLSLDI
jgi:hypothetical protein